jgi:hypothetical protein
MNKQIVISLSMLTSNICFSYVILENTTNIPDSFLSIIHSYFLRKYNYIKDYLFKENSQSNVLLLLLVVSVIKCFK